MRQSPTPYSLSIIPRSLSLEIVEGEHFVTSDLLCLVSGRALFTGDLEAEVSHREQASRASPVSPTPTSGDSSSATPGLGQDERDIRPSRSLYQERGPVLLPEYRKLERRGKSG